MIRSDNQRLYLLCTSSSSGMILVNGTIPNAHPASLDSAQHLLPEYYSLAVPVYDLCISYAEIWNLAQNGDAHHAESLTT